MNLDKKIIAEIAKFNKVNKYIMEQDAAALPAPVEDPAALPDAPAPPEDPTATPPVGAPAEKIDVATDPDVEKIDDEGESEEKKDEGDESGELDITELVDSQKSIQTNIQSNNKIQKIRYDIINRQEELDLLTNKFNRVNKNISFIKNNTNYIPDDKTLTFY